MNKGLLINEDGTTEFVEYTDYKDLQKIVNGWIEGIHIGDNGFAYVDEEGKLKNKPINRLATRVWHESARKFNMTINDFIVGKMILTGPNDDDGNDTSITDDLVEFVESLK